MIDRSPRLMTNMNKAVREGRLTGLQVQADDVHAGGTYLSGPGTITLPIRRLRPLEWKHAADTIYVIGHEVQHADNAPTTRQAWNALSADVLRITNDGGHDFAGTLNRTIDSARWDEDRAELEGWNTFVEFAANTGVPLPRAVQATRRAQRVAQVDASGRLFFRAGFHADIDGSLPATPHNIEVMRTYYTGAAPDMTNIGRTGESDYANYYAAPALSFIGQVHREHHATIADDHARRGLPRPAEPPIRIDLATHGLTPDLLQKNGIDLGPDAAPLRYLDTSTRPPTPGVLQPLRYSRDENAPSRPTTVHDHLRARSTSTRAEARGPAGAPAGPHRDDAAPAEYPQPRTAPRTTSPTSHSTPGGQNTMPTPRADAARRAVDRATRPRSHHSPRRGNTGIGR